MNNWSQNDQGLQHPIGRDVPLDQTSRKLGRVIEGHMKQEKSQATQHIQNSGIGLR